MRRVLPDYLDQTTRSKYSVTLLERMIFTGLLQIHSMSCQTIKSYYKPRRNGIVPDVFPINFHFLYIIRSNTNHFKQLNFTNWWDSTCNTTPHPNGLAYNGDENCFPYFLVFQNGSLAIRCS